MDRVKPVLQQISSHWEVIFVNDGSTDRTLETLRQAHIDDARVKIVDFSRNLGKEIELTAGIDHSSGRAVVPIDVDLQDRKRVVLGQSVSVWIDLGCLCRF